MQSSSIFEECAVFMVDDSPLIVRRIKDLLDEIKGVRFLGNAESINAILEILSVDRPDAMILDINLGHGFALNGIQLLSIIRKTNPDLIIIMLTNHSDPGYHKLCLAGGADYFFDKSNDFDKIPAALNRIIKLKNLT